MVVDTQAMMRLCVLVGEDYQIQRTVKESFKGSLYAAAGAFGGGLLMGPIGLLAGSVLGGLTAYSAKKDSFLSIKDAVDTMSDEQKAMIAEELNEFISQLEVNDAVMLATLCMEVSSCSGPAGIMAHPVLSVVRERAIEAVRRQVEQGM